MNEIQFAHKNKDRWEEFEHLIHYGYQSNPDKITDLYIHLTDELAYAKTYFPSTMTMQYLNGLAQKAHQIIYQNKPVKKKRILAFWHHDLPLVLHSSRKAILISFLILFTAALMGWVSNRYDPDFVRIILGDKYVNMTLSNIENGDPMAVYKSMNQVDMFLGISINNIYISFLAFITGIFTALGTGYILLTNGIMLGTFQGFLAEKGLLLESVSSIWIHGTLEIFSIIVAGAAGIIMGNSFIFPGTYSRLYSFRLGVLKGLKLVCGLIPFFLVAAFLEGFVTRYTHAPYVLKFSIIFISLLIILLYFFIYPQYVKLKEQHHGTSTS
jgi:uncharacterized membrane protein SpoIIM required for sporulation